MAAATMTSRVLGMVREMAYASFMGVGWITDAFMLAFMIPNLFRRLLGTAPAPDPGRAKTGRDHRDAHLVAEAFVDHRAEDDVRVLVRGRGHDLRGLVDLEEADIRHCRDWNRRHFLHAGIHSYRRCQHHPHAAAVARDVPLPAARVFRRRVHGHVECTRTFFRSGAGRSHAQRRDDCFGVLGCTTPER